MSHEEADPEFDTQDKPFSVPDAGAGEPQGQNADMSRALGLSLPEEPTTPPQTPTDPTDPKESLTKPEAKVEGQKTVENYTAKIQENAEELYATLLMRAKADPAFIDTLVESEDAL